MTTVERETPAPDPNALEEFGDRVMGILNDACTAMMLSIGHQTGLLDTLSGRAPATSAEVAAASALDERYVREWLNALTTARVLEYDAASQRYRLPDEHAAWLTEAAGPQNMARTMTFVPLLAEVEQGIVRCFRTGGGLSYADYPRFHELMAEDSRAIHDAGLIEGMLPLVDGLTDRLRSGIDVADIGCGSGHAVNLIARAFPNSRVRGFDFSVEAVEAGRAEARAWGLTNAEFSVLDVATLDEVAAYDLVTAFDAIHDQAHPGRVLANIARALRPDGVFLMVDIKASSNVEDNLELPWAPFLYTVSTMHCMTVSLGLDGEGLGTAWGSQLATSMLHDVGFGTVDVLDVETDPFNSYYVCRR